MRPVPALLAVAALVLAGCGSDPQERPSRALFNIAKGLATGAAKPPPFTLTRAQIRGVDVPLMVARLEDGAVATLFVAAENGPYQTWRTVDGVTLTTRGGVLSATRGLGPDLLAGESDQSADLLARRQGGTVRRIHRYLDGNDQIVVHRLECRIVPQAAETVTVFEVAHRTTRLVETCTGDGPGNGPDFTNTYWVGAGGTIWASRQFISPDKGHAALERLIE
jgi:hypothetical protein